MRLKAFVIDDEKPALFTFIAMLTRFCPEIELGGHASSYSEAVEFLLSRMHEIDIIFCDIDLGGKTGFDVFDKLHGYCGHIVFISAHEEFALKAYRYEPVNYLTKPISPNELITTIDRIKRRMVQQQISAEASLNQKTLAVYVAGNWQIINIDTILYIQANGSYSNIFIHNSCKPLVTSRPLKYYEEKLKVYRNFVRVQKSYLINSSFVTEVSKNDSTIKLSGDFIVPVGGGLYRDIIKYILNKA